MNGHDVIHSSKEELRANLSVRGIWKREYRDGRLTTFCSACDIEIPCVMKKHPTYDDPYGEVEEIDTTPYCPWCGAEMEERI